MIATPSLASESAEMMMMRVIQQNKQGTFHCCSGESLRCLELAQATAEVFGLNASLIQRGEPKWGEIAGIGIPRNTSLSAVATAKALDYQLPTVRQLLQTYRRQWETGSL